MKEKIFTETVRFTWLIPCMAVVFVCTILCLHSIDRMRYHWSQYLAVQSELAVLRQNLIVWEQDRLATSARVTGFLAGRVYDRDDYAQWLSNIERKVVDKDKYPEIYVKNFAAGFAKGIEYENRFKGNQIVSPFVNLITWELGRDDRGPY